MDLDFCIFLVGQQFIHWLTSLSQKSLSIWIQNILISRILDLKLKVLTKKNSMDCITTTILLLNMGYGEQFVNPLY